MTTPAKTTKHWLRAYIDKDQVSFELVCEHPDDCQETHEDMRDQGCGLQDWFADGSTDLLDFPDSDTEIGRVEVACRWEGYDEDAELYLEPPKPPSPTEQAHVTPVGDGIGVKPLGSPNP